MSHTNSTNAREVHHSGPYDARYYHSRYSQTLQYWIQRRRSAVTQDPSTHECLEQVAFYWNLDPADQRIAARMDWIALLAERHLLLDDPPDDPPSSIPRYFAVDLSSRLERRAVDRSSPPWTPAGRRARLLRVEVGADGGIATRAVLSATHDGGGGGERGEGDALRALEREVLGVLLGRRSGGGAFLEW